MRMIKKAAAMILGCVLAVGCAAEESLPIATEENGVIEQSVPDDSDIQITTHIDPETGEEHQELEASFFIKKINMKPLHKTGVLGLNEISIIIDIRRIIRSDEIKMNSLTYSNDLDIGKGKDFLWNKLKERKVTLKCGLLESGLAYKDFCKEKNPKYRCSVYGDESFLFKYSCTLKGDNSYFIKID